MWLSKELLFLLARMLYKSEIALTKEMKDAIASIDKYDQYRASRTSFVIDAINKYQIDIKGKIVADFGCSDGAISRMYAEQGARHVIGIDIDEKAIQRARELHASANVSFNVSSMDQIPLDDQAVDVIISCDVFEHVTSPGAILNECYRVLKPAGQMVIGTWGWHHPFAPHLFATMPVPWAHVFFSDKTILQVCRRVYNSPWYVPAMYDLDANGKKLPNKYLENEISNEYLNKLLVRDFEKLFQESRFQYKMHPTPFGSKYANWTKVFLRTPWVREFVTSYFWAILTKK